MLEIAYAPTTTGGRRKTARRQQQQHAGSISIQVLSPAVGGVERQRSLYHSPSLIKTNDSRCCSATGKNGTAGRRVCVGGSPSLPPPSILLRKGAHRGIDSPLRRAQCNNVRKDGIFLKKKEKKNGEVI